MNSVNLVTLPTRKKKFHFQGGTIYYGCKRKPRVKITHPIRDLLLAYKDGFLEISYFPGPYKVSYVHFADEKNVKRFVKDFPLLIINDLEYHTSIANKIGVALELI